MTLHNLAIALWRLGERKQRHCSAEGGSRYCQEALEKRPRKKLMPSAGLGTQHLLGNVLSELGHREFSSPRLKKAVEAFREALEERTQERVPLEWQRTQNGLGIALSVLGQVEGSTVGNGRLSRPTAKP